MLSLFQLIKSMSRAEKRHFKLYTGSNSKLRYVSLFDLLDRQNQYDKTAIEKAGFTPSNCNELNEKIHEALHVLRMGKDIDSRLKLMLDGIPILLQKKLKDETQKHINKAKKLAEKHQKFLVLLEIMQWEKELLAAANDKNVYERYCKLIDEEAIIRRKLDEEINCRDIKRQLYLLRKKDVRLTKPENREKFDALTNSTWLKTENVPYSVEAKVNFHYAKTVIAQYRDLKEQAYAHACSLIEVFEKNMDYLNTHLFMYKHSLCLLAEICFLSDKNAEMPTIIDKIEQIPFNAEDDTEIYNTVCLQGLLHAMSNLDEQQGLRYITMTKKLLGKHGDKIRDGRQLAFFYNFSVFYSLFDKWKEADEWLDRIFDFKRTDDRKDIQFAARLLKFMTMFEVESDHLDNHIQAASGYFKKHQQYSETNKHILQAFRNLYKAINDKERKSIWQTLEGFLARKITEQNLTTQQLGLQELQIWCCAKLQNTTIAEVIKEIEEQTKTSATT